MCLLNTEDIHRTPKQSITFAPNGFDLAIITHNGGLERTLPHHLTHHLIRTFRMWTPSPRIVLLADDVLSLRQEMFGSSALTPWTARDYWRAALVASSPSYAIQRRIEYSLMEEADFVWTVSSRDSHILSLGGLSRTTSIRFNPFPINRLIFENGKMLPFHSRDGLLFSGWAWTESSILGLAFFLQHVFYRILELSPGIVLRVVGHGWEDMQQSLQKDLKGSALKSLKNVQWLGQLDDFGYRRVIEASKVLCVTYPI